MKYNIQIKNGYVYGSPLDIVLFQHYDEKWKICSTIKKIKNDLYRAKIEPKNSKTS